MNLLKKLAYPIVTTILSIAGINNVRGDVIEILSFSLTTYTQSPVANDGTTSVIAAPKVKSRKTADILDALAQDEFHAGTWPSNSFPATAKLAVGEGGFFVVNGTNILVSVTNVMSFQAGDNNIDSGKRTDNTGLAAPNIKSLQIGKITFDDTAITGGSNLKFYIQGLISNSTTDTVPNSSGIFSETASGKMTNGAGEGVDSDGLPFVVTGTVTVSGKGTQQLPP